MTDDYDPQEVYDLDRAHDLETWLRYYDKRLSGFPLPAGRNGIGGAGIARKRPPRYTKEA